MEKLFDELDIRYGKNSYPSIEVGFIDDNETTYRDTIETILLSFAKQDVERVVSLYFYHGYSVNFGFPSDSVWICVIGSKKLFVALLEALLSDKTVKARRCEPCSLVGSNVIYHIEDGQVWICSGPITFDLLEEIDNKVSDNNKTFSSARVMTTVTVQQPKFTLGIEKYVITIKDGFGGVLGTIKMSSGTVDWYEPNARRPAKRFRWAQLAELLRNG